MDAIYTILTCLQLGSFDTKDADIRDIYIESNYTRDVLIKRTNFGGAGVGVTCIWSAYASNICTRGTCAENISFALNIYI